jgi:acyl carrier protein
MLINYPIAGNNIVETVHYTKLEQSVDKGCIWINQRQYFEGVPSQVWNFCFGNYQICHKWLKDRQGCSLSNEDIQQYQRIIMILKEIIELMARIDIAIQHNQFNNRKIFEKVQTIVAEQLGIERKQVSIVSNFINNLGATSLDMVKLFIALEEAFNIQFTDEVAKDISTVQKVVNYISQKLAV